MVDYRKAIEVITYFANGESGMKISKLHLLKMIFLADRYHLRMFARSITGDEYFAMQYGPVASACKNVAEGVVPDAYVEQFNEALEIGGYVIRAKRKADMDVLSRTDAEALRAACGVEAQTRDLVAFSHNFPEWRRHECAVMSRGSRSPEKMDYRDFFLDAPEGCEYCPAKRERLDAALEVYLENSEAERALGT